MASWWNGRHAGFKLRCLRVSRFESERGYHARIAKCRRRDGLDAGKGTIPHSIDFRSCTASWADSWELRERRVGKLWLRACCGR